jgi:hypothetical protein
LWEEEKDEALGETIDQVHDAEPEPPKEEEKKEEESEGK